MPAVVTDGNDRASICADEACRPSVCVNKACRPSVCIDGGAIELRLQRTSRPASPHRFHYLTPVAGQPYQSARNISRRPQHSVIRLTCNRPVDPFFFRADELLGIGVHRQPDRTPSRNNLDRAAPVHQPVLAGTLETRRFTEGSSAGWSSAISPRHSPIVTTHRSYARQSVGAPNSRFPPSDGR